MNWEESEEDVTEMFRKMSHEEKVAWAKRARKQEWKELGTEEKTAFVKSLSPEEMKDVMKANVDL